MSPVIGFGAQLERPPKGGVTVSMNNLIRAKINVNQYPNRLRQPTLL